MRTIEWQRNLEEQLTHGKRLFRVAELANIANVSHHALNVELERLVKRQVLERYARGVYGLPKKVTPNDLVRSLDAHAYITSFSALFQQGIATQVPTVYTCFTDRRHNRSREKKTPVGRFVFTTVKKPIYAPPRDTVIVPAQQALFDYVYMLRRQGVNPRNVVTLRNLQSLRQHLSDDLTRRYPQKVLEDVLALLDNSPDSNA